MNVPPIMIAHRTKLAWVSDVAILVQDHAVSMPSAKLKNTTRSVSANMVLQEIHLPFATHWMSHSEHLACQTHAVQILNAVYYEIALYAAVYLIIWEIPKLDASQNVQSILTVLSTNLVLINDVRILALDLYAESMPNVVFTITRPIACVQLAMRAMLSFNVLPYQW